MRIIKYILIALLILLGVTFIYDGMGFQYRIFNHDLITAYGIPAGIVLIVVGALLGGYWNVARDLS